MDDNGFGKFLKSMLNVKCIIFFSRMKELTELNVLSCIYSCLIFRPCKQQCVFSVMHCVAYSTFQRHNAALKTVFTMQQRPLYLVTVAEQCVDL